MMFENDGIKQVKNFLSEESINNLNSEIEEISNKYLINGVTRASTWINKNLYDISNPIVNINKENLLEIALDINKIISKETSKKYLLSAVRIIVEKKNSNPLGWHTDHFPDTIRGIIYIMGGENGDGSLGYIKGSHKNNHDKKIHKINPKEANLENQIENIDSKPGDLIFFNTNGFHKKNTVIRERRILFFEFQDIKSAKKRHQIILDNSKISSKILENINFLFTNENKTNLIAPPFSDHIPDYTPVKLFLFYIKTFLKILIRRIFKKFSF